MRACVIRRAFHDTLPVMAGYIVLGMGFGILLSAKGYGVLWAVVMGIMIYSGTMQFAAAEMFAAGTGLAETAITAFMMGARHIFYGLTMSEKYRNIHGLKKAYMIFALTDETYSLVCESDDEDYCFWVSLLDHSYWLTGGVIGTLIGEILPFDSRGIDFVLTALFVSICTEQWLDAENHIPAIIGFVSSVVCLVIFGAGNFLIPAMIIIAVMLIALRGKIDV
ncbi:MAG: AzlC family ABC transporter permease [Synergistaceae bacterium]|nr:AzlC family ABC transporter permease [Synergistaceae bacterium]